MPSPSPRVYYFPSPRYSLTTTFNHLKNLLFEFVLLIEIFSREKSVRLADCLSLPRCDLYTILWGTLFLTNIFLSEIYFGVLLKLDSQCFFVFSYIHTLTFHSPDSFKMLLLPHRPLNIILFLMFC